MNDENMTLGSYIVKDDVEDDDAETAIVEETKPPVPHHHNLVRVVAEHVI